MLGNGLVNGVSRLKWVAPIFDGKWGISHQ
ncbi:hypothetical protein ACVWZA_004137 [Sphingomonas sp. UYAg733]